MLTSPLRAHLIATVSVLAVAGTAAAQPGTVPPIDPSNRQAVVDLYNTTFVPALAVPNDWTGNVATCDAGTTSAAYADATMTAVNYFRAMTQLPSTVMRDAVQDNKTQLAALMMTANNDLNHNPPNTWLCYTADGAEGAANSNLALGNAGAAAVVAYVDDGQGELGHRRWILYPPQTTMGTGSTNDTGSMSRANSLWTLGPYGARPSTPAWVAWPNAGFVPYQLVYARWSFSVNTDNTVDFTNATVEMTQGGMPVALTVHQISDYGDPAIAWDPTGLTIGAGMADLPLMVTVSNVDVGGVTQQYSYSVTIIDPSPPGAPTVPGAPTGVTATPGDSQATVSFTPPASDGGSAITHYTATASPGGATALGIGSPITVLGLSNGTAYTFTVTATNGVGTGPASAPSGPVTPGVQSVGAPTNFRVTGIAGNTVSFAWTPGMGTLPITSYRIEGGYTPGSVLGGLDVPGAGASFTADLPTGAFYVRLYALSGATRSAASNEIQVLVNVPVPPSAPTNLLAMVDGDSVGLAWVNTTGGGAPSGMVLDVSGALSTTLPLPLGESFFASGVPSGTYTVAVRAVNDAGTSPPSNSVSLTVPGPCSGAPLPPVGFNANAVGNLITVSWMPPASGPAPTSYTVIVSGAFVGSFGTTQRSMSGEVGPGSYTLSVAAANSCGASAATAPQVVTIP